MSPLSAWKRLFDIQQVRLPVDLAQLDVICCDTCTRTISHIGIELENCKFNSRELQELRRRAPLRMLPVNGADPKLRPQVVQVKFNRASMAAIWVTDPIDGSRLKVSNTDPHTADLSAVQVAAIVKRQREARDAGQQLALAAARQITRAEMQKLSLAKSQAARRRALKHLGVTANFDDDDVAPRGARKEPKRGRRSLENFPLEAIKHQPNQIAPPTVHAKRDFIPKYSVISPPAADRDGRRE